MPLAGDIILATDVTRSRPRMFWDSATSPLPASSSAVAIPGISISFTTETANADISVWWTIDANPTAAATVALISARPQITGPSAFSSSAPVFADYSSAGNAADRGTTGNSWVTQLGVAGTYTVVVLGTTGATQQIDLYSSLTLMVQEQYS
jgi:hypothetical protein